MDSLPDGLDQRFLDFIGATEAGERAIHSYYLQFFQPGQHVLDLGCGAGYFVKMLREQGVEARGVDLDPLTMVEARAQNLPIIQADALNYLQELPDNSLDAIFNAHLVEHLEVEAVYSLIRAAQRVLKPGGFLLIVTPNVRSLVSHLEMFWLHFDHKRFYHPRLLEFFMQECGFSQVNSGENEDEQKGFASLTVDSARSTNGNFNWHSAIPRPRFFFMQPWWWFKKWLAQMIVLPYLAAAIPARFVGRSFEVYVIGKKHPPTP
jgi:SAM-dependent methyltransferase